MKKITLTMIIMLASISFAFSQAGNCLHFDGVNDNVRRAVLSVNNTSVSIGIRVNLTGTLSTNQYLFYNGSSTTNGFGMMIPSGSTSVNIVYGGLTTIATGFTLTPNIWTLLSLTINQNQLRFFVNGTQSFSTTTGSTVNAASSGSFSIGSDDLGNQNFSGLMEEFRFWNRTICPAAVAFRANCQLNTTEPGLIAYYPFNQGIAATSNLTVTSLLDATSNAFNATLNNFALTGTTSNWLSSNGALTSFCGIAPPNATIVPSTSAICNGASITFSVNGINTYSWSNGSNASSIAVSPSVNTTYSVIGLDNASGCIFMGSNTLNVNPNPTLSLASTNLSVCPSNSSTISVSGANSYTWSNNANTTSITVSPTLATTYSVTGANSFGCSSSVSVGIFVFPNPTVNITTSNASVCPSSSLSLSASGAVSYSWSSSATSSSIAVSPTITSTYSVVGTNTFGCQNSSSVSITVFLNPTISVSANTNSICPGSSVTINATGAQTYTWNIASNSASILVSPTITTSYSVISTNTFGCQRTSTISINVFPLPQVTAASSVTFLCLGSTTTITASGANTYSWSTSATTTSISVNPTVNTTYTVTGTNAQGCSRSTTVSLVVNTNTLTITAPTVVCSGSTTTLTASGANTYTWNSTSAGSIYTIAPTVATIYLLSATDGSNCVLNATVPVAVNALPTLSVSANRILICVGETGTISASGASSYSWSTGSTSPQIIITPTASLVYTYSVVGTNSNNCSANAIQTVTVNLCIGLESRTSGILEVNVYPNPSNGWLYIEVSSSSEMIIFNQLGAKIMAKHLDAGKNEIDLKEFNSGIYFISVQQNGNHKTLRIQKD
jgi:hypothetical protein